MTFRTNPRRVVFLSAAGLCCALLLLLGPDHIASRAILPSLKRIDASARIGRVRVTGGMVLLEGLSLPGMGFLAETAVVYWSGSILSPGMDSVLVADARWEPVPGAQGEGPDRSRSLPPVRFSGLEVMSAEGPVTLSGTLSEGIGDRRAELFFEAGWGRGRAALIMTAHADTITVPWFACSSVPHGFVSVPEILEEVSLQGGMQAVRTDHIRAEGTITSVNGDRSEINFVLVDSGGTTVLSLTSRLEDVSEVINAQAGRLLGNVHLEISPAGLFTVELAGGDTMSVAVDAVLEPVRIFSPGLSGDTVTFSASTCFRGRAIEGLNRVEVDSGIVGLGEMLMNFSFRGRFDGPARIELRLWNDSLPGERLAASVPDGLMGRLEGLRLSGAASVDISAVLDWSCPDSSDFHARVDARRLSVISSPISVGWFRQGGTVLMRDSWGGARTVHLDPEANPAFLCFDSLHPSFEGLLICAEDATFRTHRGFSEYHVRNSIRANMNSGRFARGGSTITMQLARNLFLGREKTLARKVQEIFLAWRLEAYLSKDRMLEIYANIVELGPDVYGFREAARYYFATDFDELSTRQVAYLVSILPGPRLYHRFYTGRQVPSFWEDYLDRLLDISRRRGWIDPDSAFRAMRDSIVFAGPEEVY